MKLRLQTEISNLKARIDKCTIKVSKCAETYNEHHNLLKDYDPFLAPTEPANPWISESTEFWEMFEKCTREQVAERRVIRWGFSCWELLKDPVGHEHFKSFLENPAKVVLITLYTISEHSLTKTTRGQHA